MPDNKTNSADPDRRRRLRFPISTELRYQISGRGPGVPVSGIGQVQDMSSRGLAFRADVPFQPGTRLKVSMAWPARLGECLLRLVFEGVVLLVRGNLIVVSIERPEFRTAGKSTAAAREEIAAVASGAQSLLASNGRSAAISRRL